MRSSVQIREEENLELMMRYASEAGFKEVAISFGSGTMCFQEDIEADATKIKAMLEKYGLVCRQTHLPCYHLLVTAEETDKKIEQAIKNAMQASGIIGAEWTAYHPRTSLISGYDRHVSMQANREKLDQYLGYAAKYGVGIAVENMPLYPFNHPEWRFFGGGWEEIVELVDGFHTDMIGICWDVGHAHTAALDQPAAIQSMGDRIKITHIHDNYKNGDHHQLPALASLEWGSADWAKIMAAFKDIRYEGPLTLELVFPPLPMLKSFVCCCADCLTYLKTL